jgi:hypothetical protein
MSDPDIQKEKQERRAELRRWTDQQVIRYWRVLIRKAGGNIAPRSISQARMRADILDFEFAPKKK